MLSLFISLEIDCFHGVGTRKYLHSMIELSGFATALRESTKLITRLFTLD
jgi:hypothetical protein